jgi:uncharacterized LabA/DUF88 family protein
LIEVKKRDGMMNLTRFAVFMDGNYLYKVSNFYKFEHFRHQRISFEGLISFLKKQVAEREKVDETLCHCVDSHWFKGKMTMPQVVKRYSNELERLRFLEGERYVDDALMFEGITQHVFPVKMDTNGDIEEKGIDVWLANEALELSYLKRFDVVALVACDTDFVPLIRKLNALGVRVMLISWDLVSKTHTIRTSQQLIDECAYYIPMHELIDSRDTKMREIVDRVFY